MTFVDDDEACPASVEIVCGSRDDRFVAPVSIIVVPHPSEDIRYPVVFVCTHQKMTQQMPNSLEIN